MFEWILNGGGVPEYIRKYSSVYTAALTVGLMSQPALSDDGSHMLVGDFEGSKATVYVRNGGGYTKLQDFSAISDHWFGYSGDFSEDGSILIIGAIFGGYVRIYEKGPGGTYSQIQYISAGSYYASRCLVSKDGSKIFVAAYGQNAIYYYERQLGGTYSLVQTISGTGSWGSGMALSHDDTTLVVGGYSGRSGGVYKLTGGQYESVYTIERPEVSEYGFFCTASGDGSTVAIAARAGGLVDVYKFGPGGYEKAFEITGGGDIAMNSNGDTLVVGEKINGAKAYDIKGSLPVMFDHVSAVNKAGDKIALTPDGSYLVLSGTRSPELYLLG